MKLAKLAFLLLGVLLMSPLARATFTYCNYTACEIQYLTVCKIRIENNQYCGMTMEMHYIYPGVCMTFYDEGGNGQSFWIQKNYHGHSVVGSTCPTVSGITGLPDVVCVGETYSVTATSSGGAFSALQWSGDAEIVSQSGNSADVRFPTAGLGRVLKAKNATQSGAPEMQVTTDAVTVTYSVSRGGNASIPPSVPFNSSVGVQVQINPDIGGKSIAFKVIDTGSGKGDADISSPGNKRLGGSGGTLTVNGTAQTAPGNSGQIKISTDTKPGSSCQPSIGFSVCAHPTGTASTNPVAWNAPLPSNPAGGVHIGMRVDISFVSDSGSMSHLDQVYVSEKVLFATSQSGSFSNFTFGQIFSGFEQASASSQDYHAMQSVDSNGNNKVWLYDHHGPGSVTDRQLDIFYCNRCGMTQGSAVEVVQSGYSIGHYLYSAGGTDVRVDTTKLRAAVAHSGYFVSPGVSGDVGVAVGLRN